MSFGAIISSTHADVSREFGEDATFTSRTAGTTVTVRAVFGSQRFSQFDAPSNGEAFIADASGITPAVSDEITRADGTRYQVLDVRMDEHGAANLVLQRIGE